MNNLENLNENFINEIKSKNNIVDIVARYCVLERTGSNYWACCPFGGHDEETPSLVLNENAQVYYCFGCGKGGDVIKFIEEVEKLDYYEAIKFLAENAKIPMPENDNLKKDIFEDSNDKLIAIINEKLDKVNATIEERERAIREIGLIKSNNDAKVFLFYYDLIEFMKKENIYFMASGPYYTSLYCSYLLGFLEYNPMCYNLSTIAYEEGSKAFSIEVLRNKYDDVKKYLFETYGQSLYKTTTNTKPFHINCLQYLLANRDLDGIEKVEADGETALHLPPKTWKGDNFFVFHLYSYKLLNELYDLEVNNSCLIDYANFSDVKVYEYLMKNNISNYYFPVEEIAKRKPTNIIELAHCTHTNYGVTERSLPNYLNYAMLYYKIAKLRMDNQAADYIEVK